MIARISSGTYIKGAVMYNENKVCEGEAKVLSARNFGDGEPDFQEAIFRMYQQCRRSDNGKRMRIKKPVFSCSLNLNQSDLDRLGKEGDSALDDLYRSIADRYMERMGYGSQPYLVYRHDDVGRAHVHIVSIRVGSDRRKINDSHEHVRSERVRREINEEFGLSIEGEGIDAKTAEKRVDYIFRAKLAVESATDQTKVRSRISNVLKFVDENYHPRDFVEYNKILSQFSVVCKLVDATDSKGDRITGCQFAVLGADGAICSHLIPGSRISGHSHSRLSSRFINNGKPGSDLRGDEAASRKYIQGQILSVLSSPRDIDIEYVRSTLQVRGIDLQFVRGSDGDIKGVNYVDNLNGMVHTGSAVGRNYTYGGLCACIDRHNKGHNGVDKEIFVRANKTLVSLFNKDRKQGYYFESDLIRDLSGKRRAYVDKLCSDLHLTEDQASRCFSSFKKFKTSQLAEVEHKEEGYIYRQMMTALRFASMMDECGGGRVRFLASMNISVTTEGDRVVYRSNAKDSVWTDNRELEQAGMKDVVGLSSVIPADGAVPLFSKGERDMIRMIVEGGIDSAKSVPYKSLHLIDMLRDGELKRNIASKASARSGDAIKAYSVLARKLRFSMMREDGMPESHHIRALGSMREKLAQKVMEEMRIGRSVADSLYDIYKTEEFGRLHEVDRKEEAVIDSRIKISLKFAELVADPARKVEFLKRMEISVMKRDGVTYFSYDRKPSYQVCEGKLSDRRQVFGKLAGPVPRPFSKQERDFVRDYVNGGSQSRTCPSVAGYLDGEAKRRELSKSLLRDCAKALSKAEGGDVRDIVNALLFRGIVIVPSRDGYSFSRYWSQESSTPVPTELRDMLDRSNYNAVHRSHIGRYFRGGRATERLEALMLLSRAEDTGDRWYLDAVVGKVRESNPALADVMLKLCQPDNSGRVDYGRLVRLIDGYCGERHIVVPEPSDAVRHEKKTVQSYGLDDALRAFGVSLEQGDRKKNGKKIK